MWVLATLLVASLADRAYSQSPICLGYDGITNGCESRTTYDACVAATASADSTYKGSCAWHEDDSGGVVERQRVTSKGGALSTEGYAYGDGECGFRVTVRLPAGAKWGAYYKVQGGPGNVSDVSSWETPEFPFTAAACTLGLGAPTSCTLSLVPPTGYAADAVFKSFTDIMEFFTTDSNQIGILSAGGRLPSDASFALDMELEYLRCKSTPWPTTGVKDSVVFGGSPYYTTYYDDADNRPYGLLTYRAYPLEGVTAASWEVAVAKSFRSSGSKTALDVMLLRDQDYLDWANACTSKCRPPTDKAVSSTACRGTSCTGSKSGLGASGRYWLLVSYPTAYSPQWSGSYSSRPLSTPYAKQLVNVVVKPKFSLPAASSQAVATSLPVAGSN